jgi:2'-hydroxyisoflavone reductase
MLDRREFVQCGLLGALAMLGAGPRPVPGAQPPVRPAPGSTLLILGGTGFIGPHLTSAALELGWKVTHFNRGKRAANGVAGVETLIGDRKGQLDALRGRRWDVVIDDTGYFPRNVRESAQLLAPQVGHCIFISSISAYASFAAPNDENSPTGVTTDLDATQITNDNYGPLKAECERITLAEFAGRASVVRPGYIIGPLDPTDRFTWWPVRMTQGGEMLLPGTPKDPVQVIDVRDLAAWLLKLAAARTTGTFNAVTPPRAWTTGDLVDACRRAGGKAAASTRLTWVDEDFLGRLWQPEEFDLPPWSPMHGASAGASLTSSRRAQQAGLRTRPLHETVRDTLAWFQTLPAERQAKLRAGLEPAREASALAAWHARPGA